MTRTEAYIQMLYGNSVRHPSMEWSMYLSVKRRVMCHSHLIIDVTGAFFEIETLDDNSWELSNDQN